MKKLLCLLMAVLMITFAMAACTDNENVDDDTQENGDTVNDTNEDDTDSDTSEDEYGDDDVVVAPDSWFSNI